MIIPFKDEVIIDIECKNKDIERLEHLYSKSHFIYHQKEARSQLTHYLNTGDLPLTTLSPVIGSKNESLHNALYLSNRYKTTPDDSSLHLVESALVQTCFSKIEDDYGNKGYCNSNSEQMFFPFFILKSALRNNPEESGFYISTADLKSVCLQPDWSEKKCRETIVKALDKNISNVINKPNFTNNSLKARCIELAVFSIGNPNLSVILDLAKNFPDYLAVKDIQRHYHDNEWYQPNTRYTIEHLNNSIEFYISIYPAPMESIENILIRECNQLLNSVTQLPKLNSIEFQTEFNELVDGVKAVLHNLTYNISSLGAISSARWTYNRQYDFLQAFSDRTSYFYDRNDIYINVLVKMYGIIRAYNHNRTITLKKQPFNVYSQSPTTVIDDIRTLNNSYESLALQYSVNSIEDLILEGITSFKSLKDNWLTKNADSTLEFLQETELTKRLSSYLHRNNVNVSTENDRNVGRSDLEITFWHKQGAQKAIIENKRITDNDDHSKIVDKYCSAIHQIKHYLEDQNGNGYILFFIFKRDVIEIENLLLNNDIKLEKIEHPSSCTGFNLIHDKKYKIKLINLPIESPTKTYKKSPLTIAIKERYRSNSSNTFAH
ncbi:PD-(D/E)XK nuclease domain-containing protein [Photobacterium damselae subsp. damselae]|uniref:PD-(D/E)XK nuclease domain-containing protein n=1 Tax=Photobacterium damselae TaxID=38293 RepID=UPI001F254FDD|nr:PD-(D/E)XK nuclease domain-containing protein [Photobacterium damselae]UJZ99764.1 PD-(D/E)XK nuclease domain-containing protein [Photobacterium damselae subsp. damselae]